VEKSVVQEFKAPTLPEAELPEAEKYVSALPAR